MIKDLLQKLRSDADRYKDLGGWHKNLGFWIGATHRVRTWTLKSEYPLLTLPLRLQTGIVSAVWRNVFGVNISDRAKIGPGLCLIHPHSVGIGEVIVGDNCLVFHEVTLGTNANDSGYPEIGNRVDIYAGAKILGAVKIGDDVKVGANCVVTRSVEPGATIVTAAPRVIPASLVAAFGPRKHPGSR